MAVLPSAMRMGRIDRRTASTKAGAGVLHQMPTIDNLHGLGCCSRCSLAASATAVARDDADFRLARQPVLDCGGPPALEQAHAASRLAVADGDPAPPSARPPTLIEA